MRLRPSLLAPLLASVAALALSACAATGADGPPIASTPVPATFAAAPEQQAYAPQPDWWRALKDPALDGLEARVLVANRDLLAAEAEVRQARALAKVEGWNLLPFGGASAGAGRQRQAAFDAEDNYVSVGAEVSWEADVFGRLRAGAAAAQAQALGIDEARRGAMAALTAQTASTYADLRGAQARLTAARANAAIQQDTVRLTDGLRAGGRATPFDVMRARAQLETTQAAIPLLESQISGDIAALDVLAAGLPEDIKAALQAFAPPPATPEQVFVGSPDEMLRRRPDIRRAEARVQEASARVRGARVDWWPRLTFVGSVSSLAGSIGGLGDHKGLSFNIGPQIDWPALDFRRNALRLEAAKAGFEADYLRYDTSVLSGVRDVESSLTALEAAQRSQARLEAAVAAARTAAEVSRIRYREGVDAFFNVLDAERSLAQAEDSLAAAQTRSTVSYIRLGQALGVGWSDAPARQMAVAAR